MAFKIGGKRAKPKRKKYKRSKRTVAKPPYGKGDSHISQNREIRSSQDLATTETNQILAKLDVMMGFVRAQHGEIEKRIDAIHSELAEMRFILEATRKKTKDTRLDKIVREKLSCGEKKSQIVRQLVESGACSRATAYRVLERNENQLLSQTSQVLS